MFLLIAICVVIYVVGAVVTAAAMQAEGYDDPYIFRGLLGALWPLLAVIGLTCLPFALIGWLGERLVKWVENHRSKEENHVV